MVSRETCKGFAELLSEHAASHPAQPALIFLETGEGPASELTYAALHRRARALAADLAGRGLRGQKVILLFPSGLDYATAFLGCIYAGVVAVPVYPPRNNWHAERVAVIARDSGAVAALTQPDLVEETELRLRAMGLTAPEIIALAEPGSLQEEWLPHSFDVDSLAYLQYTSGSTGDPKGVMVRHGDILHNCAQYSEAVGLEKGSTLVSWLPVFHDMGLVQGIAMPLTLGGTAVFMPPASFLQKPSRWLHAISRYRAAFSGAPNFAYEVCVNKISDEEAAGLDLSCWRGALNAAEPISATTIQKFIHKFEPYGLRPETMLGGFGLAEATLYVSCGKIGDGCSTLWIQKRGLEEGKAIPAPPAADGSVVLVGCGRVTPDPEVRIVSPETGHACEDGHVGEIWVCGTSVAGGYWNRESESDETFRAKLPGQTGSYMRTGDLGFIHSGQLYVTGRLKDLIIIRGANHYPQDIERTVEEAHPTLRKGGWGAAFSLDDMESQQLVIVQEVERTERKKVDVSEVGLAVMQAVTQQHGIDVDAVVLVVPGGVPKTSSGKIQRKLCRKLFVSGGLNEIGRWERHKTQPSKAGASTSGLQDIAVLEDRIRALVVRLSGIPADRISVHEPLSALGLSSLKQVELVTELGAMLRTTLSPTLSFEYPTIERLAAHLSGKSARISAGGTADAYEPVAIVGMSCRFPGADTPEAFWELVKSGSAAIRRVPDERRELTGYEASEEDPFGWGGFLSGIDRFDASLFGISPREAESIDPQQRLLLETTWHALESAGIRPDRLAGTSTGVFVGISTSDYFRIQQRAGAGRDAHSGTGSALSIAANRISYCLGLQGPSVALDTACSSSLVAVHYACQSLAGGESEIAIAGGVNLILSNDYGRIFHQANMLSPTGACHTFSDQADGYVRGEGCGIVVLKRLKDAERDGDQVLAVIRGSAVNQDGPSNGLTAPNGQAQQQVIRTALKRAAVMPEQIGYVETHGTGTRLGDPIEVASLKAVLGGASTVTPACWLGAVKPNIGHLEPAAGIAGLIKTVLVLNHGAIPPVRDVGALNPLCDLNSSRLHVPFELSEWHAPDGAPRRAGVSSFGFGGTNAHLIVENGPDQKEPATIENAATAERHPLLLTLSANSTASLCALAASYSRLIETSGRADVHAICHAANTRRARLPERLAAVAATPGDLANALQQYARDPLCQLPGLSRGRAQERNRIAFLFTGQGSQYAGMGRGLYETETPFREYVDRCDEILAPHLSGLSIREILWGNQTELLQDTRYAQPALVVLELAIADLWSRYGVQPEIVMGHSIGEYAAACVAGVLDLETALRLTAERGRCMSSAPGDGAMLAVAAAEDAVMTLLSACGCDLEVAAANASDRIVLSGETSAIEKALELFNSHGIEATRLNVSHAFHSRLMEPAIDEFKISLASAALKSPMCRMVLTGGGGEDACVEDRSYWADQLRRPVRWSAGIESLMKLGANLLVEIGPKPVLSTLGPRKRSGCTWIASLSKYGDQGIQMLDAMGKLFVHGVDVLFRADEESPARTSNLLPAYVFDRESYWFARPAHLVEPPAMHADDNVHASLVGRRLDIAVKEIACFETVLPGSGTAYLADHKVAGAALMPAAAYAAIMLHAWHEAGFRLAEAVAVRNLEFLRPLAFRSEGVRLQTVIQRIGPDDTGGWYARVLAWDGERAKWETHAAGDLHLAGECDAGQNNLTNTGDPVDVGDFYKQLAAQRLEYGPGFRGIRRLSRLGDTATAQLELPDGVEWNQNDLLHPVLLDAAFQAVGTLVADARPEGTVVVPSGIHELTAFGVTGRELLVEAHLLPRTAEGKIAADLTIRNTDGKVVVLVRELQLSMLRLDQIPGVNIAKPALHWKTEWVSRGENAADPSSAVGWAAFFVGDEVLSREAVPDGSFFRIALESHGRAAHHIDEVLRREARCVLSANGLIVFLEPESTHDDPVARCSELCRAMQKLLVALDGLGGLPREYKVGVVTRSASGFDANEPINLAHAGLAAMLRSAAEEYTNLHLFQIDLAEQPSAADWSAIKWALAGGETEQAIRNGVTYVPRLRPESNVTQATPSPNIRRDGGYLITGGTGGIGLALTEWLAEAGAGQIVVASRSAATDLQILRLAEKWRSRGVEILARSLDVSAEQDLAALIADLSRSRLPLRGVFHAAGTVDDRPLANMNRASWAGVMAPKAKAAYLLDRYTRDLTLDCFVLFSSIAATFGSAGQCNYAAANGFMDAIAARRSREGNPALTIHWGPWAEVGMASDPVIAAALTARGLIPMSPPTVLKALDIALQSGRKEATIAAIDGVRLTARSTSLNQPSLLRELARETQSSENFVSLETLATLDDEDATLAIRQVLGRMLRQVLHSNDAALAEGADPGHLRLSSLGVDSLMAMELRNKVGSWANVEVPAHVLIGSGTVAEVADLIYQRVLLGFLKAPSNGADSAREEEVLVI